MLARKYLNKKIYIFSCYREVENKRRPGETKRNYTLCAYSIDKEEVTPYLYSEKENRFVNVSAQRLSELQEEGLVLGTRENTNGVKLLKKSIGKSSRNSHDGDGR